MEVTFEFIVASILSIVLFVILAVSIVKSYRSSLIPDSRFKVTDTEFAKLAGRFVAGKDETIIAKIGAKNIQKLIKNGTASAGFCFLTNKAFYFIGKMYKKDSLIPISKDGQERIPTSEMKSISAVKRRNTWALIVFITLIILTFIEIVAIYKFLIDFSDAGYSSYDLPNSVEYFLVLILLNAMMCMIAFANVFHKQIAVCIEFSNGSYLLPVYTLGRQEIINFFNAVSEVQQNPAKESNTPMVSRTEPITASSSKVESLREISKLFEQGAISEEEFNRLKAEILSGK